MLRLDCPHLRFADDRGVGVRNDDGVRVVPVLVIGLPLTLALLAVRVLPDAVIHRPKVNRIPEHPHQGSRLPLLSPGRTQTIGVQSLANLGELLALTSLAEDALHDCRLFRLHLENLVALQWHGVAIRHDAARLVTLLRALDLRRDHPFLDPATIGAGETRLHVEQQFAVDRGQIVFLSRRQTDNDVARLDFALHLEDFFFIGTDQAAVIVNPKQVRAHGMLAHEAENFLQNLTLRGGTRRGFLTAKDAQHVPLLVPRLFVKQVGLHIETAAFVLLPFARHTKQRNHILHRAPSLPLSDARMSIGCPLRSRCSSSITVDVMPCSAALIISLRTSSSAASSRSSSSVIAAARNSRLGWSPASSLTMYPGSFRFIGSPAKTFTTTAELGPFEVGHVLTMNISSLAVRRRIQ